MPPQPADLTLLAAIELFRLRAPAEWTPEELAGFRVRLELSPSMASLLGGRDKIDRKLAEVAAAHAQAAAAPAEPVAADAAGEPVAAAKSSRKVRHLIEAGVFLLLLGGAAVWLYTLVAPRGGNPPTTATTKPAEPVAKDPKKSAAPSPAEVARAAALKAQQAKSADESELPEPPPSLAKNDAHTWQDWTVTAEEGAQWNAKDDWDLSDPSNPRPARVMIAMGGRLKLAQTCAIDANHRWLEVNARPLHAVSAGGKIVVRAGNDVLLQTVIGIGETRWPQYVSLEKSLGKEVPLELTYEAGEPGQRIALWSLVLVPEQKQNSRAESALAAGLASNDPKIRLFAVKSAEAAQDLFALPPLITALSDKDPRVSKAAVAALLKFKAPKARAALYQALTDQQDEALRAHIALSLAQNRLPGDGVALAKLLQDPSPGVRQAAVRGLAQIGGDETIPVLLPAMSHKDPAVRRIATAALVHYQKVAVVAAMLDVLENSSDPELVQLAAQHFQQVPSLKAIDALVRLLDNPRVEIPKDDIPPPDNNGPKKNRPGRKQPDQNQLARNQSVMVRQKAMATLASYSTSSNPPVKRAAAQNTAITPALVRALADADVRIRIAAAAALAKRNDPAAAAALLAALANSLDPQVREQAVGYFQMHPNPQAVAPLIQILGSKEPGVRRRAVIALGRIGGDEAIAALRGALADPSPEVQQAARQALQRFKEPKAMVNFKPAN
ncbi:MAG: HEAT repeat domain-containing protein [Planctomycetia bacterium]|nr:HEAT repeat domain-containing protein [Planctomycetia bacterium]